MMGFAWYGWREWALREVVIDGRGWGRISEESVGTEPAGDLTVTDFDKIDDGVLSRTGQFLEKCSEKGCHCPERGNNGWIA